MNKSPISILYVNNQDGSADPRMIWLDLPATQAALDRAMKKIGFPDAANADVRITRYKTNLAELSGHLVRHPDISHLNRLAECLSGMNRAALQRFTLFLRTSEASGYAPVLQCAEQLVTTCKRRRQAPAPGR